MKITVKNLTQESIEVEIDSDKSVKDLKTIVEEKFGAEYPASNQKLIYAGKILDDNQALSVYKIDENKFVVVMVMREKRITPPAAPEVAPSTSATSSTAQSEKAPVVVPTTASAVSNVDTSNTTGGNSLVVGEEYEKTVNAIVGMGYARPQVEQALAVSFNNPERAIEYLVNGIPENSLEMMAANVGNDDDDEGDNVGMAAAILNAANDARAGAGIQAAAAAAAAAASREGSGPLDFLRNQPQFQRMCAAVQRNPNLLNSLLQEINETNPSFINTIRQNQEEFLRLLNIRAPRQQQQPSANRAAPNNRNSANQPQPEQQQPQQQSHSIYINAEDKRAIDNLKSLGFSEQLAIEAYFACDKNENSAANFLLSQQFDE